MSEVNSNIFDCNKNILDIRVQFVILLTLDMNRELFVSISAVWSKVVITDPRKLVKISIKGFEMVVPPSTADIVTVVRFSYWKDKNVVTNNHYYYEAKNQQPQINNT